jgi:hypothetical protein
MSEIHLDPRLSLRSRNFVEAILPELLQTMALERVRGEGYAQIVSCILANLVKAGERSVIVKLSKHVRYEGLSQKQLRRVIPAIAELGWVELTMGEWRGDASTVARKGIDLAGLETIKSPKETLAVRKQGKPVNPNVYFSDEEIGGMKAQLREMNTFLETANIAWATPWNPSPDLSNKELCRIFNVVEGLSEDEAGEDYCGFGRLYGPFWLSMKKPDRANIQLNGETLAYIDFSAMNVHLGYYLAGVLPPTDTDLYDLTGLLCGYEDKPEWRKPVKKFLSSVWFCRHHQFPRGVYFPKKFKYADVYTAITRKHPKLRGVLARRMIGYQMAHLESDIMMDVLLRLKARDIVGLSIHDGLMVAKSQVSAAREILNEVTLERLGFSIPHKTTFLEPKPEPVWAEEDTGKCPEAIDLSGGGEFEEEDPSPEIIL